ncbi:hypothetical protein, partial [Methanosarcina spelaei]|uniref:hypothetical protein n=1 Tax=Methanosarcina spelaei TaxID=1036679 RepID=UPI001BAEC0D9
MEEETNKKVDLTDLRPVISFVPDRWGQIRKFIHFHNQTYLFSRDQDSALFGADGHFGKYNVLMGLAKKLAPELNKDYEELIERGFSQAIHSKELAAIIDSLFYDLYSSVDCTRRVIAAVYGKYQGITSNSTSGLFQSNTPLACCGDGKLPR